MNAVYILAIVGVLIVAAAATISVLLIHHHKSSAAPVKLAAAGNDQILNQIAVDEVSHLFNAEFREELRNRGRLRFEQIINENAMFLKQDLDVTIAQMNDYLKKEIGGKLDSEFAEYAKAMQDAQQLALSALQKSATAVEQQRVEMAEAFKKDLDTREAILVKNYEENMARIVEHYILQALSDQVDLKSQLPMIIAQMEANKENIMKDMRL